MNSMKKITTALMAVAALAACQANAEKPARQSTATRTEQCNRFADAQFSNQRNVSGTTIQSIYDEKTGYCTVTLENNTPGNTFSSRIRTNVFDPSLTTVRFETVSEPVRIRYVEPPRRLLCKSVKEQKNGQLVCDPYKPAEDEFFNPFAPFMFY